MLIILSKLCEKELGLRKKYICDIRYNKNIAEIEEIK